MNKEITIPDIEPIAMDLNGEQWLHPYINTWFNPETDSTMGNVGLDDDTYIFTFNTKNDNLRIMVKSKYLNDGFDRLYAEDDWETKLKNAVFEQPYIDMQAVYGVLYMMMVEDVWSPKANVDFAIKNSKDYELFRLKYPSERFIFTEFGKKVSALLLNKDSNISMSPDCGMWIDEETNQWGYDS